MIAVKKEEFNYYHLFDADGDLQTQAYQLFPGIAVMYEDVHAQSCRCQRNTLGSVYEIHHCREGRLESSAADDLFYMGPGDLSVICPSKSMSTVFFPLQHYHGITVIIDTEKTPHCLSCFLEDVNVNPKTLMQKFCGKTGTFVARSMPSIAHVFDELYSVPDSIRIGYLKVKILELMLFLTRIDAASDELEKRCYSHTQKVLAKKVSSYLASRMDSKITLEQLSEVFCVSGSQIKSSVKNVYGTSLYNMIRIQKMQSAAKLLRDTDMTILEVAGLHGYDNASKFSGAFKATMGLSPRDYRNTPTEIENLFS